MIVIGLFVRICCIDVGGIIKEGWVIKEYIEFYDRGYWGYGIRKVELFYDLFVVVMIMINSVYKKEFKKIN